MICIIFKFLLSLVTMWLVYLKIRYRALLPDLLASLGRDVVQLTLNLLPIILSFTNISYIPISQYFDPNAPTIDLQSYAYYQTLKTKLDGLCCQFLFLKIIQAFKINRNINWLFTAIGQTITALFFFYIISLPIVFTFAFVNYYLFGSKVRYASTVYSAIHSTFRAINGVNFTYNYYIEYPLLYSCSIILLIWFYFYIMFPITIALLLDSFNTTTKELGSITDTDQDSKTLTFKEVMKKIFVIRPWAVLAEAEKEYHH